EGDICKPHCKQNVRHSVLPRITGGDNRLELRGMLAISQNHMSLDFAVDRTSAKLRCDSLSRRICCLLKAACTSRFDLAAKRCSLTIAYGWLVGGTGAAAASDRLALEL